MANYMKSMVEVHANEETIKYLDGLLDKANDGEITTFAQTFYDDVELGESGGVMYSWASDKIGPKWTYLYDIQGDGAFSTESAWYPPTQFFIHLYKMVTEIDPEGFIEVIYEDEGYDPIGAIVIKKDKDGTPCIWEEEDNDIENPLEDMDWDDEKYDDVSQEFYESLYENQQSLLGLCHELVITDGEPIEELTETE